MFVIIQIYEVYKKDEVEYNSPRLNLLPKINNNRLILVQQIITHEFLFYGSCGSLNLTQSVSLNSVGSISLSASLVSAAANRLPQMTNTGDLDIS
jgi:hypothetical protein